MSHPPSITIVLASPRGFCAGVERAIAIVEKALKKYGAPVYVRHEIVHNKFVVDQLKEKGAIFVKELDEIPTKAPVVFSAHGVPKAVPSQALEMGLEYLDATCPLVSKVHREVEHHVSRNRVVLLIGHAKHPEVIGTMGQVPEGRIILIETREDLKPLHFPPSQDLAYATQTTLSVDEVSDLISALKAQFPNIHSPPKADICYATTNRQIAVKTLAQTVEAMIVIGSPNSSNTLRLIDVAKHQGCTETYLCQRATEMNWDLLKGKKRLGLTAGASAPEVLVEEFIKIAQSHFHVQIEEVKTAEETIYFNVPGSLRHIS